MINVNVIKPAISYPSKEFLASHNFYHFQFTNFPPTTTESLFINVPIMLTKIIMVGIAIKKSTNKPAPAYGGLVKHKD